MYLTHYGALEYSLDKAQLLARQIDAYCEFVKAEDPDLARLQQRLSDYSLDLLRQFGASTTVSGMQRALAFDMRLNAQGLDVWRRRVSAS